MRRTFLTGLVILVPVVAAIYALILVFSVMDGIFAPAVERALAPYLPGFKPYGVGALLTIALIFLLGWLSRSVLGRGLLRVTERLIGRIPVANGVYSATKGILQALSHEQTEAFKRVVLIEYPKADSFALAFVTGRADWSAIDPRTADLVLVFVPTTPNPTSGFLLLVPRRETVELPISVEQGIRMVISGGILLPDVAAGADAARRASEMPARVVDAHDAAV